MSGGMIGHSLDFDSRTYSPAKPGQAFVTFEEEAVYLPGASEQNGTPMFQNVEFVRIRFPGDSTKEVYEKVNDRHRQEYAREYDIFKRANGGDQKLDGIPLKAWPPMTKAAIATFNALNIYTVQHLASVSDGHIHRLGHGGDKWRSRARLYLESLEDSAPVDRIAAKNADLEEQMRLLRAQNEELGRLLNGLTVQLEGIKAAGQQGIGPAHLMNLAGSQDSTPTPRSALDIDDNFVAPPKRKPGRPTNAERDARAAADAA